MSIRELKSAARAQLGGAIFGNNWLMALLACLIFSAVETAAASISAGLAAILVTGPMSFGLAYIFLKQSRDGETMNLGDLFTGFSGDFGQNFLLGLLMSIFIFLWSLLLVIPGIVKSYAYSMAFFVKADHPEYDWRECLSGSQELMRGYKWKLFVLDLSFLGWYIVGALCLGVGTLWVTPYHEAAKAQFYNDISAPLFDRPYENGGSGDSWYE